MKYYVHKHHIPKRINLHDRPFVRYSYSKWKFSMFPKCSLQVGPIVNVLSNKYKIPQVQNKQFLVSVNKKNNLEEWKTDIFSIWKVYTFYCVFYFYSINKVTYVKVNVFKLKQFQRIHTKLGLFSYSANVFHLLH